MSNQPIGTAPPDAAGVLASLEPRAFWERFGTLTTIARPSRREERVAKYIRDWAAERGFAVDGDAAGNLVVRVPATAGREGAPTVVLQGHLDMVCERDPSSPYDPTEGRIGLQRDGEWLTADGTTLGADDGVAIAAMMALVEDSSLPHGPLELLMTVAEEVGLEGANGLDPKLVTGSILLNLDSEEDGRLTVGCAGSTDTWVRITAERAALDAGSRTLLVAVAGGLGGHSGTNIEDGRSNAIKVLGRVLRDAGEAVELRLVSLDGGKSRNAIPRDAHAVVVDPGGAGGGVPRGRRVEQRDDRAGLGRVGRRGGGDRRRRRRRGRLGGRLDARGHRADARRRRADPLRPARDEHHRGRPGGDQLVARRGHHRGVDAHPAQPVALVQRPGAAGRARRASRRRPGSAAASSRSSTTTPAGSPTWSRRPSRPAAGSTRACSARRRS